MRKISLLYLLLGLVVIIGIGGKEYMDNQKESSTKKILKVEKQVALYIAQNYDDVSKIKFGEINQTKQTGSWHFMTTVNDTNEVTFNLSELENIDGLSILTNPDNFKLIKKEEDLSITLEGIDVIYSEDK